MTVKERKEREREEMRELILGTASEIMQQEGVDSISIRKIANRIEYSPAIIYHYFKDKDDIVNHLMRKGYQKIIGALSSVEIPADQPEERLKELSRNYIHAALQMADEYKAVQLSSSPDILQYSSSLFKGASHKKPALQILYQCLKDIYNDRNVDDDFLELTAQIITTSTFGLIIRLMLEKDIGEEQRVRLIEHHIQCIVDGMVLRKPLSDSY